MNGDYKVMLSLLIVLTIVAGGMIYGLAESQTNRAIVVDKTITTLESQYFNVVEGKMNSPTVIEKTSDLNELIQFAKNHTITKIYQVSTIDFVAVLNDSYALAYTVEYHFQMWWF